MIIMGVDFHPEFPQIASLDSETGVFQEKQLQHREEAEKFCRALAAAGQPVRVGMEASGYAGWFERLLAELQLDLWIGDAAEIRSKKAPKQAHLGAELGEPRSPATAVASTPHGASADAS